MKNKNFIFPAIILLVVLASFTSLQHKRQIVPVTEKAVSALQMSKESVKTPATGNAVKVKGFANNFTGGLGYSS